MNRSLIDLRHRMARSIALLGLMLVSLLLCGQASAAPTLSPASGTALPDVAVNTPIDTFTITATGGAIFEWYECDQDDTSMPTNCLPPGLVLETSPGSATTTLHGTPTAIGNYDFWISALDSNDVVGKARYTLKVTGATPPLTLTAVSPGSGPAIGGTSVTLTGTNFVGVTDVTFAGVPATNIIVVSPTSITATVPAHTAGPVNVTVTTASGTSTLTNGFTYLAVPTLTIATPNSGATTGGNQVFISGTGLTGTTSLTFGGTPASSFTVNSSTSITAIAPAHAAGPVNVVATTPGGSATSVNAYTYLAVPTLNTVTPNSGPIGGGTSVTLTGTGLTGASSVTFGGVSATGWTINSPTQITATIPAGNAGVVNVSVTTAAGSASLTNAFTYIAPPVAGPVSASVGHNSSANPVTLSLSGGVASSVAISTSASHGTVTASGTSVTYTPTVGYAGTDSFTYTATNSAGTSAPATVTVTVGSPTISIAPASLPAGTAGIAYSTTSLAASGGNAPYAFSLASGALPSGLTLASNGTLSGTPTSSGNFSFTAKVTDAFSYTGTRSYTLTIVAGSMAITPATLPAPIYSSSYSQQLTVSGGVAPYTFSINGGSLPTGIALSSTGTLTGSPSKAGTYTFSVTAVDSSSNLTSVSQTYTLTIATPFIDITPITLPAATVGTGYSTSISASGGVAPFDYGIAFGALPAGMSLTSTGTLSGTPTTAGTFTFGVRASDTNRFTGVRPYSFVVGQQAPVAANINQTLAANSGASTISASLSGGPTTSLAVVTPPAHGTVNITGATGFTYTPTPGYAGVDSFTYTATGPGGTSAPATVNLAITPPTVVIGTTTLANATQNVPYTASISASGGTAPYSYTIVSGALPSGMALAPTGSLTGTPTAPGTTSFTVRVTDSQNFQASQALSLTVVAQAPVVGNVSASVAANSRNNPLTLNLGSAPVTSVAVASNPQHGTAQVSGTRISYTPTAGYSGIDSFTYTATGPGGTSAAATVSLTITPPTLVMSPASGTLPPGTVGSAYSFGLGASGGMAPYSYAIGAGSLPNGLQLDPATGVISGTPTEAANATLTVTATDANGATGSRSITLAIAAQVVTVVSSSEALSPGAVASVDLTRGATGGPFLRARVLSLSPASAGHASLTSVAPARAARAALSGFNLRFVPAAAFAGTAVVTFSLESTSGASATGTVTFSVQARPDPSKDAEVIGLLNAQSRAADRFASTQMDNFNRRLEQLHRPTCDRNSFNANVQHGRDNLGLGSLGKALRDELEGNGKGNDDEDADDTRRK
ncbi:putative Ig domain-containing protein [Pseudomonas sp. PS01300]|uniref:putative Ig domain-containing protein n=1 Tax=Pseudomonas sp. PS01300 TaxID=2991436 RepID=UPI00249A00CD|nr:putative Ig domain-containing protein [Pseudomonas sp. PS01300]